MAKLKEVKFDLEGLTCADCAGRIENELNKDDKIEHARVDMVLGKAIIELKDAVEDDQELFDRVKDHVQRIEDIPVYREGEKTADQHHESSLSPSIYLSILLIGVRLFFDHWLLDLVTLLFYFLVAGPILVAFGRSLKNKQYFDETVLMSVATLGALIIGEYGEALGVMAFYRLGEYFQHKAVDDSRSSIKALLDQRPDYARLLVDGQAKEVLSEEVALGDHILVLPSDLVPLDGRIVEGQSSLDLSSLTGESLPVSVEKGQEVLSGSMNLSAPLTLEVTKKFSESTMTKLLELIEDSSKNKAKTEIFMTKFSKVYTPIVFALSLLIMLVVSLKNGVFYDGFYRGLVFLVISCPCALVLSIPLSYFAGIGRASRHGILIKGGEAIEAMNELSAVVFDKTGTLTEGQMTIASIEGSDHVLEIAAHLESFSNHPIAKAIVSSYDQEINPKRVSDLNEVFGQGISAKFDGQAVFIGSLDQLEKQGYDIKAYDRAKTSVGLVYNNQVEGIIYLEDQVRPNAKSLIESLHERKIETAILSGDRQDLVDEFAADLGIDHALAQLLPEDKVAAFEDIQKGHLGKVAYVGDGMNDAAVLAASDVGFSMGTIGNDLAIEYSDVVLVEDNPFQVIEAIDLSKKVQRITWSNIIFIMFVKISVLLLGSLGYAKMWHAVIADVGVSLLAVLNAMRIMKD